MQPPLASSSKGGVVGSEARRALLRSWLDAGMQLGNHTASHPDLNRVSSSALEADIVAGEATLRPLLAQTGRRLAYFRFPFNHTGDTREKHDEVQRFLHERGYAVATCTIDNEDYVFESAYRRARNLGDSATARRVEQAYLAYTAAEIDWYGDLDRRVLGRLAPQVMLLHANALNAAVLPAVLDLFVARGYRFIGLSEAQRDPAFGLPDTFITPFGPMWGYRWAKERGVRVDGSREQEPPPWVLAYGQTGKAK